MTETLFYNLHHSAGDGLTEFWNSKEEKETLGWGRSRKLIDLLFKHLILWSHLSREAKSNIERFARVPLDKYTLRYISLVAGGDLVKPSSWTMGYIQKQEKYDSIQAVICDAVKEHSPIAFDVLAWNTAHPDMAKKFFDRAQKVNKAIGKTRSTPFVLVHRPHRKGD